MKYFFLLLFSIQFLCITNAQVEDETWLNEILEDARSINLHKEVKSQYSLLSPDSSYSVKVEINSGKLFGNGYTYRLVRRYAPSDVFINIFIHENNSFKEILSYDVWSITYVNDTIMDINGDGIKDFTVNWYGASGCCLKAFSDVYLLRNNGKSFSESFEFINPTFSPKEKIIRGICYGHSGETEMYKYKWNKETVDTIEYVSYEKNGEEEKTGKIIISDIRPFEGTNYKILKKLHSVPEEYKNIDGYDWFTGDF